ncbi:MAG: hypothetical protein WBM13_10725 [Bacteroidia bacterium]
MKTIKLSIKEFQKLMANGSIGHHLNEKSVATYKSQITSLFRRFEIEEPEYSNYSPDDLKALFDLVEEDQLKSRFYCDNSYKTILSAQKCFLNYANLKYYGVVVEGKRITKNRIYTCQNTKCKSILWKILNFFGLLKYI